MREELNTLIDKADKKKQAMMKEIEALRFQQVQIKMTKERERMQFTQQHQMNEKKVESLSRELDSKDQEILEMKAMLEDLNVREQQNLEILES